MAVGLREILFTMKEALPDLAPKYVPLAVGSTAMDERRALRRPETIAPKAAARYRETELLSTSIDPGFLYKIEV